MRKRTELLQLEKIPSGTAQQRRYAFINGRAVNYPYKSLKQARKIYHEALSKLEKQETYDGAIKLNITFSYKTKEKKKILFFWKTTRPDLDNLAKVFIDQLVQHEFIVDDSNIVQLTLTKRWDTYSYVLFELEEVTDGC